MSDTFFSESGDVLEARVQSADRAAEREGTRRELIHAAYTSPQLEVVIRNTGRVPLRDFPSWDVWTIGHEAMARITPSVSPTPAPPRRRTINGESRASTWTRTLARCTSRLAFTRQGCQRFRWPSTGAGAWSTTRALLAVQHPKRHVDRPSRRAGARGVGRFAHRVEGHALRSAGQHHRLLAYPLFTA